MQVARKERLSPEGVILTKALTGRSLFVKEDFPDRRIVMWLVTVSGATLVDDPVDAHVIIASSPQNAKEVGMKWLQQAIYTGKPASVV